MNVLRSASNPIIQPKDVRPSTPEMEVIGVFNPGVVRIGDEVLLLLRVAERPINTDQTSYLVPVYNVSQGQVFIQRISRDDSVIDFSDPRVIKTREGNWLTSLSHFRVARSKDGVHFTIADHPAMFPQTAYEAFGIEDPRITQMGDTFYITYSGVSPHGIVTCMATTKDFETFTRHGNIFHPDNKDVAIFPQKVGGKFYALHRPSCSHYGKPEMWIAESPDLLSWGNHRLLMEVRPGQWDGGRIGSSAVPFLTDEGWLEIYHGADEQNRYCLGAVLLDRDEPWRVITRSDQPIMAPVAPYELDGFFGNVIFSCGLLHEGKDRIHIYYGASDTCIGYAETTLSEILGTFQTVAVG